MRVYIVMYVTTSYEDIIQKVFLDELSAKAYINEQQDCVNYYITPWPVS